MMEKSILFHETRQFDRIELRLDIIDNSTAAILPSSGGKQNYHCKDTDKIQVKLLFICIETGRGL